MKEIIIGSGITILSGAFLFVLGYAIYVLFRKDENQLEKYYTNVVFELRKTNLIGVHLHEIKTSIIVQTEHNFSYTRRIIKEFFCKLRKRPTDEIIIIFEKDPTGQKVRIINEAINNAFLFTELIDTQFTETLVAYFSYKFASERLKVDRSVIKILQKNYEDSTFRKYVTTLEDKEFNDKIVINPAPEKKPVLTELILPMILYKSKEVVEKKASFSEKEKYRDLFSHFINGLYKEHIGIVYVGRFQSNYYWDLFSPAALRFPKGFIFASRGSNIATLEYLRNKILKESEQLWSIRFRKTDIWGQWTIDEENLIDYYWILLEIIPGE